MIFRHLASWNSPREFNENSRWIRLYRYSERFQNRLGMWDLPAPTDLCTLLRGYLLTLALIAIAIVVPFALYQLGWTAWRDFQHNSQIEENILAALLASWSTRMPLVFITALSAIMIIGVTISYLANLAERWSYSHSMFRRAMSRLIVWSGWTLGTVLLVVCVIVLVVPIGLCWLVAMAATTIYRAICRLPRKPRTGPGFWSIVWQWLYGRMHGICFPIKIVDV